MAHIELTCRIISQDSALVRTIEPLGTIESTGPLERLLAGLLLLLATGGRGARRGTGAEDKRAGGGVV